MFLGVAFLITIQVKAQIDPLQKKFSIFLIGDAGEPKKGARDKNFALLKSNLLKADSNSCVIFLGDNVYNKGMPDKEAKDRATAEERINAQIQLRTNFKGALYFIPGNHDWMQGRPDGWKRIKNEYQFIQSLQLSNVHFIPPNGCPGPEEISLSDNIELIVVDSQWWLQKHQKPGTESECSSKNTMLMLAALKDILNRNRNKIILFATHHPFKSYGKHGGYFTWKQHIFPLTELRKYLYIPLPVIGSIYPVYRKIFPNIQDIKNSVYQNMIRSVDTILSTHPDCIRVSGHEHNLQFIKQNSQEYIISGAGCKTTQVKKRGNSLFAAAKTGYAKIEILQDAKVSLQYFSAEQTDPSQPLFTTSLKSLVSVKDSIILKP